MGFVQIQIEPGCQAQWFEATRGGAHDYCNAGQTIANVSAHVDDLKRRKRAITGKASCEYSQKL